MSNPPPNHAELVERLHRVAQKWGAAEGPQHGRLAIADEAADALTASQARIADLERHVLELQDKIDPGHGCACSYDAPGEVCAVHSPMLAAAEAKVADLEAKLGEAREALAAETEACAKIADESQGLHVTTALADSIRLGDREREFWRGYALAKEEIAAAIRARSILPTRGEGDVG